MYILNSSLVLRAKAWTVSIQKSATLQRSSVDRCDPCVS